MRHGWRSDPVVERHVGPIVARWTPPEDSPADLTLTGHHAHLRPLDPARDTDPLFDRIGPHPWLFDYLFDAPPATAHDFGAIMAAVFAADCLALAICRAGAADPLGYACLMNVDTAAGGIEIGNVNLSPDLQRTPVATEAFFLLCDWAFDAGYRRMVWKCNALNMPSRRAAQRLGFSYEGTFRQHLIVKGRNRDTAWFAMTDGDWPGLRSAYLDWLAPTNFDAHGQQLSNLGVLTAPYRVASDPALETTDRA
ncbi:GNAT family N-acetyltransferase [Loktanella sp. TSTF-M6]|uniref:GNAT family N-acetyltransferase n=1 Tax=Loktanella gaetbuli TaxID=2881335 RepID=A0ABS8BSI1_9RHOB|nr:GNAT family protein [Loktanella gaetbuli]MCB5198700.1 GNAT family N-acetyltransferase [Loktanella gaetbuli]